MAKKHQLEQARVRATLREEYFQKRLRLGRLAAAKSGAIVEIMQGYRKAAISRKEVVLARLILVQKGLEL